MSDEKNVSRREFLKIAGIAGAVVGAGGGLGGLVAACGSGTTTTTAGATTSTGAAATTTTAAAAATTTTAAASTTTVSAGATPVEGGTFRFDIGDPSFIDPTQMFETSGANIGHAIYDCLFKFNHKTNDVEPNLAASSDTSSDGLTWTFHLKQGTKFHNGREVVAGDLKYGWEHLTDPTQKAAYQTQFSMVKGFDEMTAGTAKTLSGVTALDNYTLQVTLTKPFPNFNMVCAMQQAAPVPKEEVDKDPKAFSQKPVGNGPFMMAEPWNPGQYVKVVKFPDYAGTKPHIDGIDFRIYKDDATAFLDFQAGNLDFCDIPTGQYKNTAAQYGTADDSGLTANPGHQVLNGPELGIYEIVINVQNSLFKNNPSLRQALCLAVNRQAIIDANFEGIRKPATSIVPAGTPGYQDGAFQYSRYDVEAAKAALAKAGYPNGQGLKTIPLSYNNNASHQAIMELVQADLKAIGVNTTLDGSDSPAYWAKAQKGGENFFIGRSGWIADYPAIDNFIFNLYYSTGGNNYSHLQDPGVDKAINDARTMVDATQALAAEQAAVKQIGDFCPDIPVMYYSHDMVCSSQVHNCTFSALFFMDYTNLWLSS